MVTASKNDLGISIFVRQLHTRISFFVCRFAFLAESIEYAA